MNNNSIKLTPNDVVLIRQELKRIKDLEASIPLRKIALAKRFGVSQSAIHRVASGRTWSSVKE